jgi:hypothetical protein
LIRDSEKRTLSNEVSELQSQANPFENPVVDAATKVEEVLG